MASKRKEYDGAEDFIERMRKNAVPSYHTAVDASPTEPEVRIVEPSPPNEQPEPAKVSVEPSPQADKDLTVFLHRYCLISVLKIHSRV